MVSKFDYCEALYVFSLLWHRGVFSNEYKNLSRLRRMGFKPSRSVEFCKLESPQARAYYRALCLRAGV